MTAVKDPSTSKALKQKIKTEQKARNARGNRNTNSKKAKNCNFSWSDVLWGRRGRGGSPDGDSLPVDVIAAGRHPLASMAFAW
jgi:hypothetical protein